MVTNGLSNVQYTFGSVIVSLVMSAASGETRGVLSQKFRMNAASDGYRRIHDTPVVIPRYGQDRARIVGVWFVELRIVVAVFAEEIDNVPEMVEERRLLRISEIQLHRVGDGLLGTRVHRTARISYHMERYSSRGLYCVDLFLGQDVGERQVVRWRSWRGGKRLKKALVPVGF